MIRDEDYPPLAYAWSVAGILFALAILSYTDRYVLTLLVDPIRHELGIDDVHASLLLGTAFAIVYGVFGVVTGIFADRYNRRNLIFAGVLVWSVATIGCGLARSFQQLFAARMMVGLGEAILTPAAISIIGDYFSPTRRGTAVGFYLMAVPVGGGIAAIVGGIVLKMVDHGMLGSIVAFAGAPWRAVLVILGLPGLALMWLLLIVREPLRREDALPGDGGDAALGAGRVSLRRWLRLAPVFIGVAGMALAVACLVSWAPSVLIRNFGVSPGNAGLALGLSFAGGGACGVVLGGFIGDRARARYGAHARTWMCLIGSALALPCTLSGLCQYLPLALVGMGLFIMFADWTISCGIAAILDEMPNRSRGLATSLTFFLNVALGAGFGPVLVALVNGRTTGNARDLGFSIFAVMLPVILIVVAAFAIAVRASSAKLRAALQAA